MNAIPQIAVHLSVLSGFGAPVLYTRDSGLTPDHIFVQLCRQSATSSRGWSRPLRGANLTPQLVVADFNMENVCYSLKKIVYIGEQGITFQFGKLGNWIQRLMVAPRLDNIFNYREEKLKHLFSANTCEQQRRIH